MPSRSPIDWDLAESIGVRTALGSLTGDPDAARASQAEDWEQLRSASMAVRGPTSRITGLELTDGPDAVVVGRAEWVRANLQLLDHLLQQVRTSYLPGPLHALSSRANAVQVGLAFGWLSGKVLGQFEGLVPPGAEPRLLLIAPNITSAARAMGVDGKDFHLWVCVHEETHRLQFGAVPWLPGHFEELVVGLLRDLDVGPGELLTRMASAARPGQSVPWLARLHSPQQQAHLDRLMGLMALLEGHADWVMDQADEVVADPHLLRERFERRRSAGGLWDLIIRRLLGLELKMAQYRDGARFVRAVVAGGGTEGLGMVWRDPDHLPDAAEISDPDRWLTRMGLR